MLKKVSTQLVIAIAITALASIGYVSASNRTRVEVSITTSEAQQNAQVDDGAAGNTGGTNNPGVLEVEVIQAGGSQSTVQVGVAVETREGENTLDITVGRATVLSYGSGSRSF